MKGPRVLIYCPDRHLHWSGATPDQQGVGGGVTSRIRLAHAFAELGCDVTLQGPCEPAVYRGVKYIPAESTPPLEVDVLVAHTSGGALDISSAASLQVKTKLRFLLLSGIRQPAGAELLQWDTLYAPSNFIANVIRTTWPIGSLPVWVTPRGVLRRRRWLPRKRHPRRIIYTSHPSKGLDAAISLLGRLRSADPRFELVVCGGNGLWGQPEEARSPVSGVRYLGVIGQNRLWDEYLAAGFAWHLQPGPDAFGLSLVEAMAAGDIVLASPNGSYPELVRDGESGYLIPGHPSSPETQEAAADAILRTVEDRDLARRLRSGARHFPLDWTTVASAYLEHWKWVEQGRPERDPSDRCACGGRAFQFPDGLHCTACSRYWR
jgi:glycosyltransferase involved in cell wall biosynthesis